MKMCSLNRPFYLYICVGLAATLMRLAYGWLAYSQNFFPDLFLDSQHYTHIAQSIAAGRGSGDTAYVMSPLYPYFLSSFVKGAAAGIDGELAVWWVRGIQALAGILSCLMISSLARHYGKYFGCGMAAGWIGGLASAVYGPLIHYETAILVEVMQGFTLILALWLLVVLRGKVFNPTLQLGLWFTCGLLLGLAAGFRPVALLIVAATIGLTLLLAVLQKKKLRSPLLACGLLFFGTACTVLPFTVRNYMVEKNFVLLSAYGGMNFWIGNHNKATGLFNTPPGYGFHLDPIGVELARKITGKNFSQKEASDWWSERAINDIKADPQRWLNLYFRKIFLFFHFREIPQLGNDFHWFAKKAWPLQFPLNALPLLLFALSLPFSVFIFQRDLFTRILLPYSWLIVYVAGISLFFITGRYRTPIMPIVFVLAATHAALLWKNLFSAKKYLFALVMLIALLFCTFILTKTFNSKEWLPSSTLTTGLVERQRGMAFFNQKNYVEAENWYRQSLAIKDSPMTRGNLANALKAQGRIDEAEKEYKIVLQQTPNDHVVWYNVGNLYRDYKHDDAQAAAHYEKAIELNRKFAEPYLNLALIYLRNGQPDKAEGIIEKGLDALDSSQHKIREQLIRLKVELALRKQASNGLSTPQPTPPLANPANIR